MNERATEQATESSPVVDLGGRFDAKELAEKIRKRVHQKMESGFYNEKEVERVAKLVTKPQDATGGRIGAFSSHAEKNDILGVLDGTWDTTRPIEPSSPRGGFLGALIKTYKKLYNKLIHPTLKFSLVRQAEYNSAVARTLRPMADKLEDIDELRRRYLDVSQRVLALETTMDSFDERIRSAERNDGALTERVETLASALRDLDKQGIFLKRRVTKLLDELASGVKGGGEWAEAVSKEKEKLESFDYTLFENIHRGTREQIKTRQKVYMNWFAGANDVLDVGCGRGELLELFRENGVKATGVDLNEEMVEECKRLGLSAIADDAIEYIKSLADGSLGGVSAVQFIEHLPTDVMTEFFRLSYEKLKPGAVLAAETINPACLTTFCGAFYLDMSHNKPIHPQALQFLLERIGFSDVRIEYLNPYPEDIRLKAFPLDPSSGMDPDFVIEYNRNVDKLNNVLFSHADYAVVAKR